MDEYPAAETPAFRPGRSRAPYKRSDCGYVREHLSLSVRAWTCGNCGESHDRDENAALNILAAGQVVSARGFGVSPKRTSVRGGSRSGSVKRQKVSR